MKTTITNDVMRQEYRELSEHEREMVSTIKKAGQDFWDLIGHIGSSRELSLAKTKTEEAVMWAVKHLTGPDSAFDEVHRQAYVDGGGTIPGYTAKPASDEER